MTNAQIIADTVIAAGIYTKEEVEAYWSEGRELPVHTLMGWAARGRKLGREIRVRKGEHGIETKLWKRKDSKKAEDGDEQGEEDGKFYLAKAFLFRESQIEFVDEKDA